MRIHYKLTREDIVEANRTLNGGILPIMQVVGYITLALGIAATIISLLQHKPFTTNVVPIVVGLYLTFGWTAMVRNAYKRDRRLHQDFQAEITEGGVEVSSSTASSKYTWPAFRRWSETANLFLLFHGPKIYNPYPKRAFSIEEAEEFRSLLTRNVPLTKPASTAKWIMLAVLLVAAILLGITIYRMH
jgi:YcxB-like protein